MLSISEGKDTMQLSVTREHDTLGNVTIDDRGTFIIVTPIDAISSTPLGCQICGMLMRSDDVDSARMWGCCATCERTWIEGDVRQARWRSGWRPDSESFELMLRSIGVK